MRHTACNPKAPNPVSCICGVAIREDDVILVLDACNSDYIHTISYSGKNLPLGSGISADPARLNYKVRSLATIHATCDGSSLVKLRPAIKLATYQLGGSSF